jgi:hypothetical protein
VQKVACFEALGADVQQIAFSELITALKQKTVDGQENPLSTIYNNSMWEANQIYLSLPRHTWEAVNLTFSNSFWESLTEEQQTIIEQAAAVARDQMRTEVQASEQDYIQKLEAEGVTVTEVDLAEFKAAMAPAWDRVAEYEGSARIWPSSCRWWKTPPNNLSPRGGACSVRTPPFPRRSQRERFAVHDCVDCLRAAHRLMLVGVPVCVAMGVTSASVFASSGLPISCRDGAAHLQRNHGFTLLAIPFSYWPHLMNTGGIRTAFSTLQGDGRPLARRAGQVNIFSSVVFSACPARPWRSGGPGHHRNEAMDDAGYEHRFSAGITAASATIGPVIPPSIPFVVYASARRIGQPPRSRPGSSPGC